MSQEHTEQNFGGHRLASQGKITFLTCNDTGEGTYLDILLPPHPLQISWVTQIQSLL